MSSTSNWLEHYVLGDGQTDRAECQTHCVVRDANGLTLVRGTPFGEPSRPFASTRSSRGTPLTRL